MSRHFDPLSLANAHVQGLHPYVPGLQPDGNDWAKLNTNENPFPPSSKVVEAIQVLLSDQATSLRKYPNPTSASLREAIARHHGLEPNGVVAGNGADDILNLLMRVYGGAGHRVGMMEPSYSLYPVLAGIQDAELVKVSFDLSMQLDIDAVAASGTTIFFLTSPNAPTGVGFTTDCIEKILQSYSGILVVDETYAPFADEDATSLLADYPHLVVVRSFSKAYSLAGLRVGYAL
ncbi:MAG: aminotransferase class I/II-fold pyridoxal phosphate-dependent enzyme, partial [Verrucomicrobiota bacterium]